MGFLAVTQGAQFDRALIGKEIPPSTVSISEDAILRYCRSTGTTGLIYTDAEAAKAAGYRGLVVPIAMYTQLLREQITHLRRTFDGAGLGAGISIEVLVPSCAGDVLEAVTHLKDMYTKTGRSGTMDFALWETGLINEQGERVAIVHQSYAKGDGTPGHAHSGR